MAISLEKGQKVDLTKGNPGLNSLRVGIGWDASAYDGDSYFDLDSLTFMLDENDKCVSVGDIIYFDNFEHTSGSVRLCFYDCTNAIEGDEQIAVDLTKVPESVTKIAFTVLICEQKKRKQNFGQVDNVFIQIVNNANGQELVRCDLGGDFSTKTEAVVVGELYRNNGEWEFNAIGRGFSGGLVALCQNYGMDLVAYDQ